MRRDMTGTGARKRLCTYALLAGGALVIGAVCGCGGATGGGGPAEAERATGAILFARGPWQQADIYVASPNGTRLRKLIDDAREPAVSRSGRLIAFVREHDIWVADAAGHAQHRVTHGHDDWTPAWGVDDQTLFIAPLTQARYSSRPPSKISLPALASSSPTEATTNSRAYRTRGDCSRCLRNVLRSERPGAWAGFGLGLE